MKGGKGDPPGPGKPDDRNDKDKDKYQKEDKIRKSSGKFDRIGKVDKEADSGHEESMEEDLEQLDNQDGGYENFTSNMVPLAAFHPN